MTSGLAAVGNLLHVRMLPVLHIVAGLAAAAGLMRPFAQQPCRQVPCQGLFPGTLLSVNEKAVGQSAAGTHGFYGSKSMCIAVQFHIRPPFLGKPA